MPAKKHSRGGEAGKKAPVRRRKLASGARAAAPSPQGSEAVYRLLMEQSPVGILVTDVTGQITKINPTAVSILGSPSEEASLRFNVLTLPNARRAGVSEAYETVIRENRAERLDVTYVSVWGRRSEVALQIVPLRDDAGTVVGTLAMIEDVTAQRRAYAEKAALLEIARDMSGTVDLDVVLDRVHRRTAALLPCDRVLTYDWDEARRAYRPVRTYGIPADLASPDSIQFAPDEPLVGEVLQGSTLLINEGTKQALVPADLLRRFRIGGLIAVPLSVRGRRRGALCAVRESPAQPFDEAEAQLLEGIAQQVGIALDAADLYRAQQEEAAISAALARVGNELMVSLHAPTLEDRLGQLTVDVLECDGSGTFLLRADEDAYVPVAQAGDSPSPWEMTRLLRLPRDLNGAFGEGDVIGLALPFGDSPLAALQRGLGFGSCLCMALRSGGDVWGVHVAGYRRENVDFGGVRLRIARGIAQLASFALENARLLRELENASRLKSDFVATMSHELRTPLNAIIGYCDLLLDGAYSSLSLEQHAAVKRLQGRAHELFELITATLDVSRLEAGQLPVDLRAVDLRDLLEEMRAESYRFRLQPGVALRWDVAEDLPTLSTDAVKVKVILKNLLSNAAKFTQRGSITISARPEKAGVALEVADTGIGIGAEEKRHIFEAFRQVDSSNTRRYGGVGLGLYIVRRLADLLEGTIEVDTEPGSGATFRVRLPSAPGRMPAAGPRDRGTAAGDA